MLSSSKKQGAVSPIVKEGTLSKNSASNTNSLLKPSQKTKEYTDPSGFKFNYPEDVTVEKKETKDNNIYSKLQISSLKTQGKIDISVEKSNLTQVAGWFKNNLNIPTSSEIKKTKLAELEARQFETKDQLTTLALDQGALFKIIVNIDKNKDFWLNVNEKIISTFSFVNPEVNKTISTPNNDAANSEDVVFEEEEIVE